MPVAAVATAVAAQTPVTSADRHERPAPEHFVTGLFAHCRIVTAPSEARAAEVLDTCARRPQAIAPRQPPQRHRRLLDALIAREHAEQNQGSELLALAALGEANVAALKAQPWPSHFNDLRRQVKRLYALLTNGARARARPTARALGLKSVAALIEALDRIGVRLKAADGEDLPAEIGEVPGGAGAVASARARFLARSPPQPRHTPMLSGGMLAIVDGLGDRIPRTWSRAGGTRVRGDRGISPSREGLAPRPARR